MEYHIYYYNDFMINIKFFIYKTFFFYFLLYIYNSQNTSEINKLSVVVVKVFVNKQHYALAISVDLT